ncbi:MAG: FtsX-like permease family protein [Acetatifactor sp.]
MNLMKKLVCKNLLLNKKRTIVTIIGIILSVALLSALSAMVASFQKSLVVYQKEKAGDYHVGYFGVTSEELAEFDSNRGLEGYFTVSEEGYAVLEESKNEYKPYCRIAVMDEKGFRGARLKLLEGRLPENENEVVIPRHLKTNGRVEYHVGDTLTLQLGNRVSTMTGKDISARVGYQGRDAEKITDTCEKTYTIVGIVERPNYGIESYECPGYTFVTYGKAADDDLAVYTRLNRQGLKNPNAIIAGILGVDYELFTKVSEGEATEEEFREYTRQMDAARYSVFQNGWLISYERVWPLDSSMLTIFVISVFVTLIIIFTSVYCIKNSFDISVTEKTRQYGMLSSIGATRRQIRRSVHSEAAIMGCIGIPIGIFSGLFAAYILIKVSNLLLAGSLNIQLVFYPSLWAVVIAVILGAVTIYFSAVGSAAKAGKVSPLEAIRNQNEIKLNAKSIRAPKYVGKLWGIGGIISYKNIKRNKRKYRTTVVSIVICTVTFLVISYFMSMAMSLVGASYTDENYNLYLGVRLSEDSEFDSAQIEELENIEKCSISRTNPMIMEDYELTDEYKEYLKAMWGQTVTPEDFEMSIIVLTLDEKSFSEYAGECGVMNAEGKVILVNSCILQWNEEDKSRSGEISTFRYKAGDIISFYDTDDSEAVWNEAGELIEESIKKVKYRTKIDAVTGIRPMGYKASNNNFLVMSWETAEQMELRLPAYYDFHFVSKNVDKLQDDVEVLMQNREEEIVSYSLYNRDKNQREEKSLFLLLDIFAYGLIVVIALIGITNIINTLSTSMELRSREFATLRSVGMTDAQFHKMVLLESVFTGGKSLLTGVTIGMLLSYGINKLECSYDTIIPFRPPILAAIIAVAVVMIMIYAIIRASMMRINRKNVIETIKNENV